MSVSMSAYSTDATIDFPYRAVSRGTLFSVIFAAIGAIGLIPTFAPVILMTVPGIICAITGLRAISAYPDEYSGKTLGWIGLVACTALLVGGVAMHTYIYMTEVPDGYTRVEFFKLQTDENLPDQPTQVAMEIDGQLVFLKGYIHPSSGSGMLRQFILVPDLGTCCFGGQPRSSDMIEITLPPGQAVKAGLTKRKLAGTFRLNRLPSQKTDFENAIFYKMNVDQYK